MVYIYILLYKIFPKIQNKTFSGILEYHLHTLTKKEKKNGIHRVISFTLASFSAGRDHSMAPEVNKQWGMSGFFRNVCSQLAMQGPLKSPWWMSTSRTWTQLNPNCRTGFTAFKPMSERCHSWHFFCFCFFNFLGIF